eukprot:5393512-Amphidinium_carterae.1
MIFVSTVCDTPLVGDILRRFTKINNNIIVLIETTPVRTPLMGDKFLRPTKSLRCRRRKACETATAEMESKSESFHRIEGFGSFSGLLGSLWQD